MSIIPIHNVFEEIVLLLFVAAIAGIIAMRLRQPPIIGFIAVGILVGPSWLNLIRSTNQIHVLAEMGLALLLFIVGLKLDLNMIRSMGPVSLIIGFSQVVVTTLIGFLISHFLGMNMITSFYVAMALTFSSTIIIIKLLSDKNETESLYGRISLGLLIVQDVVVVLVMVFLSAFSGNEPQQPLYQTLMIGLKGIGFISAAWILGVYIAPHLLSIMAKSSEMLVLFGIVWALTLASAGELFGFSKEIGAFVAGISIASTPYREAIGAKLSSLRDFLLLFFFIELGSSLNLRTLGAQIWAFIPLSLFVLIGKPIIMMAITGIMGYKKRTTFLAALTTGQVSEFSLILMAMGVGFGQISKNTAGIITLTALITIGISSYMIIYSQNIYRSVTAFAGLFERRRPFREDALNAVNEDFELANTMIFGLGSYGTGIAEQFGRMGRKVIGIDFDPQAIRRWRDKGMDAIFGDANDADMARALHFDHIKWVISSIRNSDINTSLLNSLHHVGYTGLVAVAAYDQADKEKLRDSNVNLMFNPFEDAAVQAVDLIYATEDQIAREAMDKLIESMSDHYIICGYGRMGQQIVKDLTRYNVPCVVVEWNPEQLPKLRDNNIPHVEGKATEDICLLKAGILRAKGLIAVAASDEENVFIVLTAKVLNPNLFIVARSILQENEDKLRHAGADRVMSPYILGGRRIAAAVIKPEVMDFLDLVVHDDGDETEMATIIAEAGSNCVGKSLRDINPWEACGVTLLAIRRAGEKLHPNPRPDTVINEGDELIVMGTPGEIKCAQQLISAQPE